MSDRPTAIPTPDPAATTANATLVAPSGAPTTDTASVAASLPQAQLPPTAPVANVVAPQDLWERMQRGFAMPDLVDERVDYWERWYASRPDYLQRMTDRASKYLFHIVEELERRGLPLELALLPFIESAFNPQAVSRAKAAGMWQFMPATGRHFDLKQNLFRDDRRDVLASTRAALDYLQRLYQMFGDWHLALAAYNWGEGNVQRAVRRNADAGLATGYLDLRLPAETRDYVPKLQAMKNLVAGQRQTTMLPAIGNHPFFDTVRIERDIDVALIARLADISEADFRSLNPSHNKPVIMAAGTPEILLPWDNAVLFVQRLRQHDGPLASWTAWRVPKDMTAAEAARQLGWEEAALRQVNHIPPRMRLKAGATLLVPRDGRLDRDVPEHLADNAQLLLAPERAAVRTVQVRARAGDTLVSVARRHRVRVADLAAWNDLTPQARLRAGQTLRLQLPVKAAALARKKKHPGPTQARGTAAAQAGRSANPQHARAKKQMSRTAGASQRGQPSGDQKAVRVAQTPAAR
ncbi:transglycosylase SLT domain-containing protein [Tepidimonas charontis]|nr:transglycosylase SLT domain-containing protein [Tepidimonas charontis]